MNSRLKEILLNSNRLKVMVVGDLILDEYIWGNIDRISPEAPVGVLECKSENSALGGAANVANNLSSLGRKLYLVRALVHAEKPKNLKQRLIKLFDTFAAPPSALFSDLHSSTPTGASGDILSIFPQIYSSSIRSPTTITFSLLLLSKISLSLLFIYIKNWTQIFTEKTGYTEMSFRTK